MKKIMFAGLLLATAAVASAQQSDNEAQKIQAGLVAMQNCLAGIDEKAVEEMRAEGKVLEERFDQFCESGKHDAAKKLMLKEGRAFSKLPVMGDIQKCMRIAEEYGLPGMSVESEYDFDQYEQDDNVCD